MSLVQSAKVPLGSMICDFRLADPDGTFYDSKHLFGTHGLLLAFTCNHCPYAIAVWPRLVRLAALAKKLGIVTVAINPNVHPEYPEDSPDNMKIKIKEWQIDFLYLIDDSQKTARAFDAQCTPDLYLYDATKKLVYHGRIDDNWQDETKVTRHELRDAIENLAHGKPINSDQKPSMGCSIKWNSPAARGYTTS